MFTLKNWKSSGSSVWMAPNTTNKVIINFQIIAILQILLNYFTVFIIV